MKDVRALAADGGPAAQMVSRMAFIAPCLATPASEPPTGSEWVAEIKYDGYRVQAHVASGSVTLLTRSGHDWTSKFGLMTAELSVLPVTSAIIDGEAIVEDARGLPDFHALQREIKKGRSARIALMAFDLLEIDGSDMRERPLLERKRALKQILGERPKASLLRFSDHLDDDGSEIMRRACALGFEGVVCKRVDRPYRSGRTGDWVKIKCILTETFVVGGYVPLAGANQAIGSLILGFFQGGKLHYAGRVGTGFTSEEAHEIWVALQAIHRKRPPFATALNREQTADAVWVEPRLAIEVAHRGWTHDDVLRHSVFKRFRLDVVATHVSPPASLRNSG